MTNENPYHKLSKYQHVDISVSAFLIRIKMSLVIT